MAGTIRRPSPTTRAPKMSDTPVKKRPVEGTRKRTIPEGTRVKKLGGGLRESLVRGSRSTAIPPSRIRELEKAAKKKGRRAPAKRGPMAYLLKK